MNSSLFVKQYIFLVLLVIALNSCKDSSALKDEFLRQRILDYKSNSDTINISDELLQWDTADFVVKHLNKYIDTTTYALELMNASPKDKLKIISLFNGLIKKDIDSFKDQIRNQFSDPPIKNKTKLKGHFRMNERIIKFSQPLVSSDNNTIVIKEWASDKYCWGSTISVYQRVDNRWVKGFDIYRYQICR
jgi:hypothetical protein